MRLGLMIERAGDESASLFSGFVIGEKQQREVDPLELRNTKGATMCHNC